MRAMKHRTYRDDPSLRREYSDAESRAGRGLQASLKADLPEVRALGDEILADLDATTLGVGWWQAALSPCARALIADYLLMTVRSIETNLLDARLHELEALSAWADVERWHAQPQQVVPRESPTRTLRARRPLDELPGVLFQIHVAGFFRAIGSALDCLGGALVGTVGLPCELIKVGFKDARAALNAEKGQSTEADQQIGALRSALDQREKDVGPTAWLPWTLEMRNMLVHRARRMSYVAPRADTSITLAPNGRPFISWTPHLFLPRAPARSDIEDLVDSADLGEISIHAPVQQLLGAIRSATAQFVAGTAKDATCLWQVRRQNPMLLPQSPKQWKMGRKQRPGFGFADSTPLDTDALVVGTEMRDRLRAAGVLDDRKGAIWGSPRP